MTNFTTIAEDYRRTASVQASASERLMALLAIEDGEDVLDVGCGTGHLTAALRERTKARLVGIDPAAGMIEKAKRHYSDRGIEFARSSAEGINFEAEFNAVFCNSAFQWFPEPLAVLQRLHGALRPGGRIGMQAPATERYCPNFLDAIDHCRRDREIDRIFDGFRSPWLFLESADAYGGLFEEAGFEALHASLDAVHQRYGVERTLDVFRSGAAAGYLNPGFFACPPARRFFRAGADGCRRRFRGASGRGRHDRSGLPPHLPSGPKTRASLKAGAVCPATRSMPKRSS